MKRWKPVAAGAALVLAVVGVASAQNAAITPQEFRAPPEAAKPRVWWHWMSGNVTREGITADLEWMHRVGIGGLQMFDGDMGVAQYLEKPVIWMTPEWKADFRHAGAEAERLHLEMSMAASGGWSETAGPWVKPEQAMKKVVWSEMVVKGGRHFHGALPQPPRTNGPFQGLGLIDLPNPPMVGGAPGIARAKLEEAKADPTFYADTVVLAYRQPRVEEEAVRLRPKITASDATLDVRAISDRNYDTVGRLKMAEGSDRAWVQWEFERPVGVRSFVLQMTPPPTRQAAALPNGKLEWSMDGRQWTKLLALPGTPQYVALMGSRTYSFAPVQARFFRMILERQVFDLDARMRGNVAPNFFDIVQAELSVAPRINFFEDKASFGIYVDLPESPTPVTKAGEAIVPSEVVNLTGKMRTDGTLDWDVPEGEWVVLRVGYSLTGKKNHPATPAATGFEVDKLSAEHVREYMQTYTGMISGALGENYGKSFRYFLMDSWEAGRQNWTEDMIPEFVRRRGYDPTAYLPVLTGKIVGSAAESDAFLWDYRRTIGEMLADNHYRLAKEFLAKQSIGLYGEAMGVAMPTTGDGLLNKGQVTVPMGEFWTPKPGGVDMATRETDVVETASAAHIYGRPIAAAESFTSMPSTPGWGQSPFYLKGLADQNFARGINQIVFHTSDHQAFVDDRHKPGMTLGYFGQHYSRNITWAEQALAWNTYLARCSYLLQSGEPAADIAYFYGEGAPVTVPWWKRFSPALPKGYAVDYLNSDVLLHQASVVDGKLALKAGPRYRVLVIPDEETKLTLAILRQVAELVKAGAVVVAPRTIGSPSLEDRPHMGELRKIANELWGSGAHGSHAYGKGRVYWGSSLEEVFVAEHISPDFLYGKPRVERAYEYPLPNAQAEDVVWIHRKSMPGDAYFISNQRAQSEVLPISFRVTGKVAELWHPDTGTVEPVSYKTEGGRTVVDLRLGPLGSVFVVFREAGPAEKTVPEVKTEELVRLPENWKISFPPKLGAPEQVEVKKLASWTENSDTGVRYFSGTATYSQDVSLTEKQTQGGKILLELGRVREIAEVTVNGREIPETLWKPPFTVDVTEALRAGANHIEVKVTNLWPNRIIGDQQPDAKEKYTFTVYGAYQADSPLVESGLLGPVRLVRVR
ncbi:glycoside hydrolase [Granulicella sp. WH15]|uniref:glycosyl hydrolase n=1 Tax=Granulicella sp. WH15 TaxID=2602070 RepID=UPI001366E84E|nr:glycosyl hydrolase [Granulicella sp. WH15]QHN02564.1 glycoside hydrolase [Granulicella sp. WH15]